MQTTYRKKLHHINLPGHSHELTFSCYRRLPLLTRERPCRWMIDAIDAAREKHNYHLFAFVIMPEHVHMIVQPQETKHDIAWFLKSIKQSVSRKAHNWLVKHDQHWLQKLTTPTRNEFRFWQAGGGYDRNIEKHSTLMKMIEYIHLNPVKRNLVNTASDWKWSSASWYEGKHVCSL